MPRSVSYTHLDVYKRQQEHRDNFKQTESGEVLNEVTINGLRQGCKMCIRDRFNSTLLLSNNI